MSVKVIGIKKLNANAYDEIVIRKSNDNYLVRVNGKKLSDEYVSISYKLSDNFKKISDSKKIILIVDSFLENMSISSIELSIFLNGCKVGFIKISGTRDLYLQIDDMQLLRSIIRMVKNKYNRDRYKYLIDSSINDSYSISLSRCVSSYERQFYACESCDYHGDCEGLTDVCPKYIQFKLMYINGKIVDFDMIFIERFIYDKLWEYGKEADILTETRDIRLIEGSKIGEYVDSYCIKCGDLRIRFNCTAFSREYILNFCNQIVDRYNKELMERDNNIKKRQLKMEGF